MRNSLERWTEKSSESEPTKYPKWRALVGAAFSAFLFASGAVSAQVQPNAKPDPVRSSKNDDVSQGGFLPGEYLVREGYGTLKIFVPSASGVTKFELGTGPANVHSCHAAGVLEGSGPLRFALVEAVGDVKCQLVFQQFGDQSIKLLTETSNDRSCTSLCGNGADLEQVFLAPAQGCSTSELRTLREAAKKAMQARVFAQVPRMLLPMIQRCAQTLHEFESNEMALESAQALLATGHKSACLDALKPLVSLAEIPEGTALGFPSAHKILREHANSAKSLLTSCGYRFKGQK